MSTIKFAKKWIFMVILSLLVSLTGVALLIFYLKHPFYHKVNIPATTDQAILTNVIAAELAEDRNHSTEAAQLYLKAAELSGNKELATNAMAIAYHHHNNALLLQSTQLYYELCNHSAESSYLYAYALLLNHHLKQGISIYAPLLQTKNIHLEDYTPLVPSEILKDPKFKSKLAIMVQDFHDNAAALLVLAIMYYETGDTNTALKTNALALKLDNDNYVAIQNEVLFYTDQNKPDLAISFLEKTLSEYPGDVNTKQLLSVLYYEQNKFDLAKPLLQQLLTDPQYGTQSALYLGEIAKIDNNITLAKQYFMQARKNSELQPFVDLLLGDMAVEDKQYDDAVTWYKGVTKDPYYFQAQLAIAKVLYLQGDSDAAHQYLQTVVVQTDEQLATLIRFETALYFMKKDWHGARNYLYKAVQALPDNADILYALVITDEQLGQFDEAKEVLQQALTINPNHINSLNAMGELLAIQYQQYDEAKTYLKHALSLSPNNSVTLHTLGWIYYETNNYNDAVNLLQRAYSLDPDPEIAADLGEALWAIGETGQATDIWNKALKTDPQNTFLKATMKRHLP